MMEDWYRRAAGLNVDRVCENRLLPDFAGSEIELQARWFAGEFGNRWMTEAGVPVEILDFGEWNREPGPDFTGVRMRFGAGNAVRGDVEIDFDVRDWERHGHGSNPAFDQTALHLFLTRPPERFFTRTEDHREVPQVRLVAGATSPDGAGILRKPVCSSAAAAARILRAAARHRLEMKAAALQRGAALIGTDNAWFQAFAVALGYKRNKIPFLLLSQRAGLRPAAGGRGEALLFGLSGFLEGAEPSVDDREARLYLRGLWESWWDVRSQMERLILPRHLWAFGGIRPANHPHRRVAALAAIAKAWKPISGAMIEDSPKPLVRRLEALRHPFWESRFTLAAAILRGNQSLIGRQRITDILLNIYYPLAAIRSASAWESYLNERGPKVERAVRRIAERFFGPETLDHEFLSKAVHQQGLFQIERDFGAAGDPEAFLAEMSVRGALANDG